VTQSSSWPTAAAPTGHRPQHWWSPAPAADAPPLSSRRAYAEMLIVFAIFFGAGVVEAILALFGDLPQGPIGSWGEAGAASWDQVAQGALAVGVVLLLAWRRGLSAEHLGLRLRRNPAGRIRWWAELRVCAWALFFMWAGLRLTAILYHGSGALPFTAGPDFLLDFFHAFQAGFIEEAVVLAFVVATLAQARRPRPEVVLLALVLRDSYHLYYGWGTIGITIWALGMIWIFLRTRSLIPLIVAHSAWDVFAVLGSRWTTVAGLWGLIGLLVLAGAAVSWLVERSNGTAAQQPTPQGWELAPQLHQGWSPTPHPPVPPGYAPNYAPAYGYHGGPLPGYGPQPGWYADPAGGQGMRWWDGAAWTAQVRYG
jgi:hypothetical protein